MARLVDMRRTEKEKREDVKPIASELLDVPWGLRIRLTQDELDKLDVDDGEDMDVGDVLVIRAIAEVTSVSAHKSDGEENCCVELSVTHMCLIDDGDDDEDDD